MRPSSSIGEAPSPPTTPSTCSTSGARLPGCWRPTASTRWRRRSRRPSGGGGRTSAQVAAAGPPPSCSPRRRLTPDLDVDAAVHDAALDAHLDAWSPHTITYPEAAPLLVALRERGIRIGLLSNTHWPRRWHEHWLARDGVLELIDARVYTSDLPHTKPHPEAFRAVLAELDASPERSRLRRRSAGGRHQRRQGGRHASRAGRELRCARSPGHSRCPNQPAIAGITPRRRMALGIECWAGVADWTSSRQHGPT